MERLLVDHPETPTANQILERNNHNSIDKNKSKNKPQKHYSLDNGRTTVTPQQKWRTPSPQRSNIIHDYLPPKLPPRTTNRVIPLDKEEEAEEGKEEDVTVTTSTCTKRPYNDETFFLQKSLHEGRQCQDNSFTLCSRCYLEHFFNDVENSPESSHQSFLLSPSLLSSSCWLSSSSPSFMEISSNNHVVANIKGEKRQRLTPRKLLFGRNEEYLDGFFLPNNNNNVLHHIHSPLDPPSSFPTTY